MRLLKWIKTTRGGPEAASCNPIFWEGYLGVEPFDIRKTARIRYEFGHIGREDVGRVWVNFAECGARGR
jgi:hypothetical protein